MRSAFAVFLRGFTLPFGASTGRRIVFDGVNGVIVFYDSAGKERIRIGGAGTDSRILFSTGNAAEGAPGYIDTVLVPSFGGRYVVVVDSPSADGTDASRAQIAMFSSSEDGTQGPLVSIDDGAGTEIERLNLRALQLELSDGLDRSMGITTLVAGTKVVTNTRVKADSRIFAFCQVPGGTPGFLRISARVVGTSFTILSSSATDTSQVAWLIVNTA